MATSEKVSVFDANLLRYAISQINNNFTDIKFESASSVLDPTGDYVMNNYRLKTPQGDCIQIFIKRYLKDG